MLRRATPSSPITEWLEPFARYVVARELYETRDPSVANVEDAWSWRNWDPRARDADFAPFAPLQDRFYLIRYSQWLLDLEWKKARSELAKRGVQLMGDLPFVVSRESADVFARPDLFQHGVSLGAPPDDFSRDGQDWGLPPYDFYAMDKEDLSWLRQRTQRERDLFDAIRIDHLVGLYRQYVRKPNELGVFDPQDEGEQERRGERVLNALREAAAPMELIAEDLGVIPPFVRASMARLGMPGYRVIPWERDDMFYRNPANFPRDSVVTWSTHDTAPITAWWDEFNQDERNALSSAMSISPDTKGTPLWQAQMRHLLSSGSDLALTLLQEVIGSRGRINTPGTISEANWSWRLPRSIGELEEDAEMRERLAFLVQSADATARL